MAQITKKSNGYTKGKRDYSSAYSTYYVEAGIDKPDYVNHDYDYILPVRNEDEAEPETDAEPDDYEYATETEAEPNDYESDTDAEDESDENDAVSGNVTLSYESYMLEDGVMYYSSSTVSYTYDVSDLTEQDYFYVEDDYVYCYDHLADSYNRRNL